jgi:hypothetical protein
MFSPCGFRKLNPLDSRDARAAPARIQALLWRAGTVALNRAPDLATAASFTSFSRTG